ncbi:pentapeptide repeat-containing protein [Streptomyces sp. NPDC048179]|uniref:pentapeptide repeat-containing protein n=1 Tax=Streptomyces sp. NPDC048179 TaxID=3365506 RepID=UPI0037209D6B
MPGVSEVRGATLRGAALRGAPFRGAALRGAALRGAAVPGVARSRVRGVLRRPRIPGGPARLGPRVPAGVRSATFLCAIGEHLPGLPDHTRGTSMDATATGRTGLRERHA